MTGRKVPDQVKLKLSREEKYTFINTEGVVLNVTQYEMFLKGYLSKSEACAIVKGRRIQCRGWSLIGVRLKGKSGKDNGMFDSSEYRFAHEDYGSVYCTRSSLIKTYGLSDSKVSLVISGRRKSHKGWSLHLPEDGN